MDLNQINPVLLLATLTQQIVEQKRRTKSEERRILLSLFVKHF